MFNKRVLLKQKKGTRRLCQNIIRKVFSPALEFDWWAYHVI